MLEYKNASEEFAPQITKLVQETIASVYPKYYPKEVVDFFAGLHCEDAVRKDIRNGNIRMLLVEGCLAGTGSREGDHITRVVSSRTSAAKISVFPLSLCSSKTFFGRSCPISSGLIFSITS